MKRLYFYYEKPGHFVRNCLKKKSDEKEQMFVVALGVNDQTTYDWIIDFGVTKHMTFE